MNILYKLYYDIDYYLKQIFELFTLEVIFYED